MCEQRKRTGWFIHLGTSGRTPDGKKPYARGFHGERAVYTDDEAKTAIELAHVNYPNAHLRPAYGPRPTSELLAEMVDAVPANLPTRPDGPGTSDLPADGDPAKVTDEQYDAMTADQKRVWHHNMAKRREHWLPFPA